MPSYRDRGASRQMIHARGLGRRFGEQARPLRTSTSTSRRGSCLLVTGPNGSGKTTLLRLLAGLLRPHTGELEVAVDRAQIGFLGHEPLLYRELTPLENLDLYGRLYRVPERRERIGMLLERFGLWEARRERTATYSTRHAPASRALPDAPARARAAAARRAVQRARRGRRRAAPRRSSAGAWAADGRRREPPARRGSRVSPPSGSRCA